MAKRLYRKHYFQKMPPGSRCVHRPSFWGNPYKIGRDGTRAQCIALFIALRKHDAAYRARCQRELRGKDLVCFCPLSEACHVDVLIVWANEPDTA